MTIRMGKRTPTIQRLFLWNGSQLREVTIYIEAPKMVRKRMKYVLKLQRGPALRSVQYRIFERWDGSQPEVQLPSTPW
jgi:hypothetical protein